MSGLTTHVLDTAQGKPASGIAVRLFAGDLLVFSGVTNGDGRCPGLVDEAPFAVGRYRLEFAVADYFRDQGIALPMPPFLDVVRIDFGIADLDRHYHVPLLVSPYGYSTYRGS